MVDPKEDPPTAPRPLSELLPDVRLEDLYLDSSGRLASELPEVSRRIAELGPAKTSQIAPENFSECGGSDSNWFFCGFLDAR
jgi:hypothetical protein